MTSSVSNNSNVNDINQSTFQPQVFQKQTFSEYEEFEPINSFSDEDEAIISSEAKLQYELEKFNADGNNFVDLAGASVMAKFTTEAEVSVINTKKSMMDTILEIGN